MNAAPTPGPAVLDLAARTLRGPAGEMRLTPQCVRLLARLARADGVTVVRADLIAAMDADRPRHPDADRREVLRHLLGRVRRALDEVGATGALGHGTREGWHIPAGAVRVEAGDPDAAPRPRRTADTGVGRPLAYAPAAYRARLRVALHRVARGDGRGWQAAAAMRLGVSDNAVSLWASGAKTPSLALLVRIARTGGVNLHWVLVGSGPVEAPEPSTRAHDVAPHAGAVS